MIKEGQLSGLVIMLVMLLSMITLVWITVRLIISKFKSDKIKGFKYDIKITVCMIIMINSVYIKFFASQFLKYRIMEYAPIIAWAYIIGVIPYNIVTSLICGIRGNRLIISTLIGVVFNVLTFIFSIGVI